MKIAKHFSVWKLYSSTAVKCFSEDVWKLEKERHPNLKLLSDKTFKWKEQKLKFRELPSENPSNPFFVNVLTSLIVNRIKHAWTRLHFKSRTAIVFSISSILLSREFYLLQDDGNMYGAGWAGIRPHYLIATLDCTSRYISMAVSTTYTKVLKYRQLILSRTV